MTFIKINIETTHIYTSLHDYASIGPAGASVLQLISEQQRFTKQASLTEM